MDHEFRRQGTGINWAALIIAAGLLALAGIVAWDAYHIRTGAAAYARVGPRAFPYAIAASLAALSLATVLSAFRLAPPRPRENYGPLAWIVGGLLAQLIILPFGGFSLATGAVFAATAKGFGRGPLWLTYPVGVLLSLTIWFAFARGLSLVLPTGPLERLL